MDGDLMLFESMAINLYLAKRYGGALYPATPLDAARAWQWSVWAISEIEPLQMQIVVQILFTPEEKKNPKVIPGATKGLQRPLRVLDAALAGRDWLIGDAFSVAGLNLAAVMYLMKIVRFDYRTHTNAQRWAGVGTGIGQVSKPWRRRRGLPQNRPPLRCSLFSPPSHPTA